MLAIAAMFCCHCYQTSLLLLLLLCFAAGGGLHVFNMPGRVPNRIPNVLAKTWPS
jgi:hypothetical protein